MIRRARLTDIPELLRMIAAEHEELQGPLAGLGLDLSRTREVLKASMRADDDHVLVSEVDGEIRGLLWFVVGDFVPWSSDVVAVDQVVYVKPQYRGSFTAAALVRRYTALARELGAAAAYLSTSSGINEEATVGFYQSSGYQPVGRQMMRVLA